MTNKEIPDTVRPYTFHGLELKVQSTQATGTCPFCNSRKFFVGLKTGQYDCKKCGKKGNKHTFLSHVYDVSLSKTVTNDLKKISRSRDSLFPSSILAEQGIALVGGEALIPCKTPGKKHLSNLVR